MIADMLAGRMFVRGGGAPRAVRQVDFDEIYVNRIGPKSLQGFHTGYRNSGIGGADGSHGLEVYLGKKTVYVNYGGAAPTALMPYSPAR